GEFNSRYPGLEKTRVRSDEIVGAEWQPTQKKAPAAVGKSRARQACSDMLNLDASVWESGAPYIPNRAGDRCFLVLCGRCRRTETYQNNETHSERNLLFMYCDCHVRDC